MIETVLNPQNTNELTVREHQIGRAVFMLLNPRLVIGKSVYSMKKVWVFCFGFVAPLVCFLKNELVADGLLSSDLEGTIFLPPSRTCLS